jgi:tryptophan-rich sensory protein
MSTFNAQLTDNKLWVFIIAVLIVYILSALVVRNAIQSGWYQGLNKPTFAPPAVVSSTVWFVLYFIMAYVGYRSTIMSAGNPCLRRNLNILFALQLVLVFLYALVFFGRKDVHAALYILLLLVVVVLAWFILLLKVDKTSAVLVFLYLLWLIYTAFINGHISSNNQ